MISSCILQSFDSVIRGRHATRVSSAGRRLSDDRRNLDGASAVICSARSASLRRSRRIPANVLFGSVSKLGIYRNEGSRIDFMKPRNRVARFRIYRYRIDSTNPRSARSKRVRISISFRCAPSGPMVTSSAAVRVCAYMRSARDMIGWIISAHFDAIHSAERSLSICGPTTA